MKSFRSFLIEVVRDTKRATKLLNYLQHRVGDQLLVKNHKDAGHYLHKTFTHHDWESMPSKTISMKKLIPNQDMVDTDGVMHKMNRKKYADEDMDSEPNDPVSVIHHQGKFHLMDGHHRYFRNRLLGKDTIKAKILKIE
jgi:hypothetical protein